MKNTEIYKKETGLYAFWVLPNGTVCYSKKYVKWLEAKLTLTDVGFSETEVCGYCDGDKWISEGVRYVPCPSCGCTGVKQT